MCCVSACPRRLPHQPEEWCASCRDEYERWLDDGGAVAALALAHREADAAIPATRAEWVRRLDDVAPLISDLVA